MKRKHISSLVASVSPHNVGIGCKRDKILSPLLDVFKGFF